MSSESLLATRSTKMKWDRSEIVRNLILFEAWTEGLASNARKLTPLVVPKVTTQVV